MLCECYNSHLLTDQKNKETDLDLSWLRDLKIYLLEWSIKDYFALSTAIKGAYSASSILPMCYFRLNSFRTTHLELEGRQWTGDL